MATYYARVRIRGIGTDQDFKVEARSAVEARKIIEMRTHGKKVTYIKSPQRHREAPRWYRGV